MSSISAFLLCINQTPMGSFYWGWHYYSKNHRKSLVGVFFEGHLIWPPTQTSVNIKAHLKLLKISCGWVLKISGAKWSTALLGNLFSRAKIYFSNFSICIFRIYKLTVHILLVSKKSKKLCQFISIKAGSPLRLGIF